MTLPTIPGIDGSQDASSFLASLFLSLAPQIVVQGVIR